MDVPLWKSGKSDKEKLDILLNHSFDQIKRDGDLIITLMQLAKNYLGYNHTTCEKEHYRYYIRLQTLKKHHGTA